MVEVADELRVDGAAELGHLSVGRGDEDALHRLHQHIVEQRVLSTGRQPDAERQTHRRSTSRTASGWVRQRAEPNYPVTHFMVLYISSLSFSVRVFLRVPR